MFSIMISSFALAQGSEDFTNSMATSGYADGSFVGNNGVTWTYVHSRDGNGDANMSGISLPALMLRRVAEGSKITSSSVGGGITDFSVKLYKGFTGGGDRIVELFVNGVSFGTSTPFDDLLENTFSVTGINVAGNVFIELVNTTTKQVIIDDITWTGFATSCGVALGQGSYTCNTNIVGDNNDSVTINIPYTGSDAAITSVTTTSGGTIEGDNPATVANGTITITGLLEGAAWDVALVGGDCGAISASGTVPAAECDPIPNTCFDLSGGAELLEIVTVASNSDMDVWTESSGTYSINGYCGSGCMEESNGWLVFGPLDMTSVTDLGLLFDSVEGFDGSTLDVQYTADYSSLCPDGATWTSAQTISDDGSYSVDLSAATGTDVFVGVQYLDSDGTYSSWTLSNVSLAAFGPCPALGARPTSDCALCNITLQTETYTCATNIEGDNNDAVTINIGYSGSEDTITSVTTTSAGMIVGDDPAAVADGTIMITGLSEGDAWDLTINGGDCDGTTVSGTVPAAECDPEILVINEINADPSNDVNGEGDSNGDGTANFRDDEFLEFYNTGTAPIVMDNYSIEVNGTLRHTFTAVTLQPNSFITVFGGGTPTGIPGNVQVSNEGIDGLSLSNGGATVTLKDNNGLEVVSVIYTGASSNQSIGRDPDFTGPFVQHTTIGGNGVLFSPGLENDDPTLSTDRFDTTVFTLYPNPTNTGSITITSSNTDAMNVLVYDILGKQVKNETLSNNTLDVSNLRTGIYIVKITQNAASVTKKLVIR